MTNAMIFKNNFSYEVLFNFLTEVNKMKHSITLTESEDSKEKKVAKYLTTWNGNDMVQIHTKETLYNEYKETNLFDEFDDDSQNVYFFSHDERYLLNDYLNKSSEDDDFLGDTYYADNMTIEKIV